MLRVNGVSGLKGVPRVSRQSGRSFWSEWFNQVYWFEDQNVPTRTLPSVRPSRYAAGKNKEASAKIHPKENFHGKKTLPLYNATPRRCHNLLSLSITPSTRTFLKSAVKHRFSIKFQSSIKYFILNKWPLDSCACPDQTNRIRNRMNQQICIKLSKLV